MNPRNPDDEQIPTEAGGAEAALPFLLRFQAKKPPGGPAAAPLRPPGNGGTPAPSVASLTGKVPGLNVLRYVGCGGMGFVFEAEQEKIARRVALKILRDGFGPLGKAQFEAEARALAELNHDGIVICHGAGVTENGWPYFYMEWVEGRSLAEVLRAGAAGGAWGLPLEEALDYAEQAARALAIVHARNILHLDLKPGNLMLTAEGKIKVLDFGLALARKEDGSFPETIRGFSDGYAAPEQKAGGKLDVRTDVFSLGATLYHLLTGRLPQINCELPSVLAGVDDAVDDLVSRTLHTENARRPADMLAFARELHELRTGERARKFQAAVILGSGDPATAPDAVLVEQLLKTSAGAERWPSTSAEAGVDCVTPGSAATLGLRWLHLDRRHTAGMALATETEAGMARSPWPGRLAALARPGQFLVTRQALDRVRAHGLRDSSDAAGRPPRFHLHGRYSWAPEVDGQSSATVVVGQICPAGEWSHDPFHPPANPGGGKPWLEDEDDCQPGEQLAAGLPVPHCPGWVLVEKLGQGGYGEVWLAAHPREAHPRAFKFCHDAARLESFRREGAILRYLAHEMPEESGFSRLLGEQLTDAPFSLQMQYFPLGNLALWLERQGGIDQVPLERRLELLTRTAHKVAAAHNVGVIHRDLKPSNILIESGSDPGTVVPRLADFGLSGLDESTRQSPQTPQLFLPPSRLWMTATRMYAAPDPRTSAKSDVYALGIMLLQLYVGRFDIWPAEGWRDEVDDPLVQDEIAAAIYRDPERRPTAGEFATQLTTLESRRGQRREERRQAVARSLWYRRLRFTGFGLASLVLLTTAAAIRLSVINAHHERDLQREKADNSIHETELVRAHSKLDQQELELAHRRELEQRDKAYADSFDKASFTGGAKLFEQARGMVSTFQRIKAREPESLTVAELRGWSHKFSYALGLLGSFGDKEQLDFDMFLNDVGIDVNMLGLEKSPGEITFAVCALQHALRGGKISPKGTPEEIYSRYARFQRGLAPGRAIVKHAGTTASDFSDFVQLLQHLAYTAQNLGEFKVARAYWNECREVAQAGEKLAEEGSQYRVLLHDDAEDAGKQSLELDLLAKPAP